MDLARSDTLLRSLTQPDSTSRRGVGQVVIGLALGGLGIVQPAAAAKSGTCKAACGECQACDKGKCKKKNGKKRCRKGTCRAVSNRTCGNGGVCQGGSCVCPSGDGVLWRGLSAALPGHR